VTPIEAIQDVINTYNRVVDDREFDRLHEVFDGESRYWLHGRILTGVDAVIAGLARNFDDGRLSRHWTANTSISDVDATSARAVSDMFFMEPRDGMWVMTIVGRYHDSFRHTGERWVIAERRTTYVAIPNAVSDLVTRDWRDPEP
jgi:3-phenylpropionate/cinnamic acid dioxygenase small subunit